MTDTDSRVTTEVIADTDRATGDVAGVVTDHDVVVDGANSPAAADASDSPETADQADSLEAEDVEEGAGDHATGLVREGDIAADYLERLLDIADYDGDIDLDVENDRAVVAIVGGDLRALVGVGGQTLDALQELTRLAVQQQTGNRSRLMLDISGHRKTRREELTRLATDTATRVIDSGESARLAPMNPFERKVVHDAIAGIDGVRSESDGEEPNRRVVILTDE